jgi:hypothetical protein
MRVSVCHISHMCPYAPFNVSYVSLCALSLMCVPMRPSMCHMCSYAPFHVSYVSLCALQCVISLICVLMRVLTCIRLGVTKTPVAHIVVSMHTYASLQSLARICAYACSRHKTAAARTFGIVEWWVTCILDVRVAPEL